VLFLGAKGDGYTDDTDAIQRAVNEAYLKQGYVFIPEGTYLIDALKSINLKSNSTIIMTPKTVLKAIPNSSKSYAVLNITNIENVSIIGGIIYGERLEHTGTDGQWGMGIRIIGSNNIFIRFTRSNNCWGDGFYIGGNYVQNYSQDIQLIDVSADNNRRQGISLISGRNIHIVRANLTNTHGHRPQAGLDIEPNTPDQIIENVNVVDLSTSNNTFGLLVSLGKLDTNSKAVGISIQNHKDENSEYGMVIIGSRSTIVPGSIDVEKPIWRNSKSNGLVIRNNDYRSLKINIKHPYIFNPNANKNADAIKSSAIAIYDLPSLKIVPYYIGNIHIYTPVIRDTRSLPLTSHAIYLGDLNGRRMSDISIVDPLQFEGIKFEKIKRETNLIDNFIVSDQHKQL